MAVIHPSVFTISWEIDLELDAEFHTASQGVWVEKTTSTALPAPSLAQPGNLIHAFSIGQHQSNASTSAIKSLSPCAGGRQPQRPPSGPMDAKPVHNYRVSTIPARPNRTRRTDVAGRRPRNSCKRFSHRTIRTRFGIDSRAAPPIPPGLTVQCQHESLDTLPQPLDLETPDTLVIAQI